MNFGALRVINDDYIKGPSGFGKHPHRDAEIFTYIVEGQLSHEDSMGNKEALPRGCVQYLSAGTGITHSVCLGHDSHYAPFDDSMPHVDCGQLKCPCSSGV